MWEQPEGSTGDLSDNNGTSSWTAPAGVYQQYLLYDLRRVITRTDRKEETGLAAPRYIGQKNGISSVARSQRSMFKGIPTLRKSRYR